MQDVTDFYEEVGGELVVKVRPETKAITDLERVINLGKPQPVIDSFAEMVAVGYQWDWFEDYLIWLEEYAIWLKAKENFEPEELEDGSFTTFTLLAPTEPIRPPILSGADVYAPYKRSVLKQRKLALISDIVVEVAGYSFDGDEDSQNRIMRAVFTMTRNELREWTLADNSIKPVSRATLREALKKAWNAQATIWQMEDL